MDNIISFIFCLVCLKFALRFHYVYFARGAKISDEQLMQNYVMITQKKQHPGYFPAMKVV